MSHKHHKPHSPAFSYNGKVNEEKLAQLIADYEHKPRLTREIKARLAVALVIIGASALGTTLYHLEFAAKTCEWMGSGLLYYLTLGCVE